MIPQFWSRLAEMLCAKILSPELLKSKENQLPLWRKEKYRESSRMDQPGGDACRRMSASR